MIQDLHSHTWYSACGRDEMETVIETALAGGIELLGISDHNYGIGNRKQEYLQDIQEMKKKYEGRIRLLRGIEIATLPGKGPENPKDIAEFDYCLIEHIDESESVLGADIIRYAEESPIPVGIAHTDLFGFSEKMGIAPLTLLSMFHERGIFWEMNVNYDSIHKYREHKYVKAFLENREMLDIVKKSGIRLSVGFDGHRAEDYLPERVIRMNRYLEENGVKKMFE